MTRPRGPRRYDFPRDPAAVLRELRAMRRKVSEFQSEVTFYGPIFKSCEAVRAKIDDLAAWLTRRQDYFSAKGSSLTDSERAYWARWAAIERGEVPWPGRRKVEQLRVRKYICATRLIVLTERLSSSIAE